MAKFVGHIVPSISILMFTTWWLYNIFRDFFASIGHRRPTKVSARADTPAKIINPHNNANQFPAFRSRIWYADSLCRRMPLEIAVKVFLPISVIVVECALPGEIGVHDLHHYIMYLAYIVDGLVDLMVYYKWPLPKHSDTASYLFQVVMQIIVYESHQHGKTPFDQALHRYVLWNLPVLILLVCLQSTFRSNVTLALFRAFSFQLFGTWMAQTGFLVEPISEIDLFHWQTKNEGEQLMIIGFLFGIHFLVNFLMIFVFGAVVCFTTKKPIEYFEGDSRNSQNDDIKPLLLTNLDKNNEKNAKNILV